MLGDLFSAEDLGDHAATADHRFRNVQKPTNLPLLAFGLVDFCQSIRAVAFQYSNLRDEPNLAAFRADLDRATQYLFQRTFAPLFGISDNDGALQNFFVNWPPVGDCLWLNCYFHLKVYWETKYPPELWKDPENSALFRADITELRNYCVSL